MHVFDVSHAREGVATDDERAVEAPVAVEVVSRQAAVTREADLSRPTIVGMTLRLAQSVVPSLARLMHWSTEGASELVVVGAAGRARERLGARTPLTAPLVQAAIRRCGSVVRSDRRVLFAPVLARGRLIAGIELVEPLVGGWFRDADVDAMDGAADLVAQFFM